MAKKDNSLNKPKTKITNINIGSGKPAISLQVVRNKPKKG